MPKNGAIPAMSPVEVQLESASIVDPLPFDVPFRLTGNVPAGSTELLVEFARTTDLLSLRKKCTKNARTPEDRASCEAQFVLDTTNLVWTPASQRWVPLGGAVAQAAPFSITIPALDAEQYYRFRFTLSRTATPEQEVAFRNAVRPSLGALVAEFIPDARARTLTDFELQTVWTDIRSRLRQAVAPGLHIKPTSIFSNDASWAEVKNAFNQAVLTSIIMPQTRRNFGLANVESAYRALSPRLVRLVNEEALDRVLSAARTDTELQKVLHGREATVALSAASVAEADRLAHGDEPTSALPAPPALGDLRDSVVMMQTSARYEQLSDRLRDLRAVLEQIQENRNALARLVETNALSAADTAAAFLLVRGGERSELETAAGQANTAAMAVATVARATSARLRGIDEVVLLAAIHARDVRYVEATTTGDESTIYSRYVSADAGYAYAFGMRTAIPYLGTNIYFGPVNKYAPLSQRAGFRRRFSITVGVTLKSVADDEQTRRDLSQLGKAMVLGAGFRVRQSVRVTGGTLLLEKRDENHPLDTSFHPGFDGFAALSFDVDVASLPAKLGELFK